MICLHIYKLGGNSGCQADDVRVGDGPFGYPRPRWGIGLKIVHDSWNTILVIPDGHGANLGAQECTNNS
jgi:hypothetical protein